MFNRNKYLNFLELAISRNLKGLSEKEKLYTREKGTLVADLFEDLEKEKYLKKIIKPVADEINHVLNNTLKNSDQLMNMYTTYLNLIDNRTGDGLEIPCSDNQDNKFNISANQIAIISGLSYSWHCELMRQLFMSLVDFEKVNLNPKKPTKKIKIPNGIGQMISDLNHAKLSVKFFDDVDNKIRNAFSHLEFEFKVVNNEIRIYCDNKPDIHKTNVWRNSSDNSQQEYILLPDLFKSTINVDRSSFALMTACVLLLKESGF